MLAMSYRIVLYCVVLYCAVLYCAVLCCIVLSCVVLCRIVSYCVVLCRIVSYCVVLCCSVVVYLRIYIRYTPIHSLVDICQHRNRCQAGGTHKLSKKVGIAACMLAIACLS